MDFKINFFKWKYEYIKAHGGESFKKGTDFVFKYEFFFFKYKKVPTWYDFGLGLGSTIKSWGLCQYWRKPKPKHEAHKSLLM